VGFLIGDTKVISNAPENFSEVLFGVQALDLCVEMNRIALLTASVAVVLSGVVIEVERGFFIVMEGANRCIFTTPYSFNLQQVLPVERFIVIRKMVLNFFATILLSFYYPNKQKQDKTRGKTKTVFPLVYWFLPKNSYHQKLPNLPQHQKAQLAAPAL
jgi:hypothetical protein